MTPTLALDSWPAVAAHRGGDLPLLDVALLIALDEYPGLDARLCKTHLEACALSCEQALAKAGNDEPPLRHLTRHLFEELGFHGDRESQGDPRNSYINEVLERRRGIPISLALVQMEVAKRVGVPLDGIAFPGHFLVRSPMADGFVVLDPFNGGRALGFAELKRRAALHLPQAQVDDSTVLKLLEPATPRTMLVRMLRNLIAAYHERHDMLRVARCADRLLCLAPDDADALRDRGLAYAGLGHDGAASADLARYLRMNVDDDPTREVLLGLAAKPRLH